MIIVGQVEPLLDLNVERLSWLPPTNSPRSGAARHCCSVLSEQGDRAGKILPATHSPGHLPNSTRSGLIPLVSVRAMAPNRDFGSTSRRAIWARGA